MSENEPDSYKLEHAAEVKDQIQALAAYAKKMKRMKAVKGILESAVQRLKADPHGWGDPEFHSKSVEGVVYHAIIRPVVFRYVVYDQVRSVVLLDVRLFADLD